MGFNTLYNYHAKISNVGFDLDAKNWDSSISPEIIRRIPIIFNRIYQVNDPDWCEVDDTVRTTLMHYVDRALVLIGDLMVMLPGGNNSGQSTTSQTNSMANHVILYYIWKKRALRFRLVKLLNIQALHKSVAASFYGDDLMLTVALRERRWFTPRAYMQEGLLLGIEFTPADKGANEVTFKALRDMEFLKRNFTPLEYPNGTIGNYFGGALQDSSFHHMLDLCATRQAHHYFEDMDEVNYDVEAIRSTCLTAQLEACARGRQFFKRLQTHLQRKCDLYGITNVEWMSYTTCFNMTWDTELPDGSQPLGVKDEIGIEKDRVPIFPTSIHLTQPNCCLVHHGIHESDMASREQPAVVGQPDSPATTSGDAPASGPALSGMQSVSDRTSGVINPATGAVGMLPSELYTRNIAIGNITWSTTQNTGAILFQSPISPAGGNVYVQYFSQLYNAWAGGMEYSILIAGTGFNGGKLVMVHVPPNYDVADIQGLQDITVFPYKVVDVKEAGECVTLAYDERNVLFHWRTTDPSDISSTGGTFAIFVLAPLVNSNGVPGLVNIVLFNRPSPNFRVAQLMPIQAAEKIPNNVLSAAAFMPQPGSTPRSPYTDSAIESLVVQTYQPTITLGAYGARRGDGSLVGRPYTFWGKQAFCIWNQSYQTLSTQECNISLWGQNASPAADISRPLNIYINHYNLPTSPTVTNTYIGNNATNPAGVVCGYNDVLNPQMLEDLTPADFPMVGDTYTSSIAALGAGSPSSPFVFLFNPGYNNCTVIEDPEYPFTFNPLNGECVVYWQTAESTVRQSPNLVNSLQCSTNIETLTNVNNLLTAGQALLIQVYDTETGLPIGYLKFYYEGVFTTTPSSTVITAPLNQLKFKPTQVVDATSFIPETTEILSNQVLVESRRRSRGLKNLRTIIQEELGKMSLGEPVNSSARSISEYVTQTRAATPSKLPPLPAKP